jgi:hypothetical protein
MPSLLRGFNAYETSFSAKIIVRQAKIPHSADVKPFSSFSRSINSRNIAFSLRRLTKIARGEFLSTELMGY